MEEIHGEMNLGDSEDFTGSGTTRGVKPGLFTKCSGRLFTVFIINSVNTFRDNQFFFYVNRCNLKISIT